MDVEATFRLFDTKPISYINTLSKNDLNNEMKLEVMSEIKSHFERSSAKQKNISEVYDSLLMILDKYSVKLKEKDFASIINLLNMYTYY